MSGVLVLLEVSSSLRSSHVFGNILMCVESPPGQTQLKLTRRVKIKVLTLLGLGLGFVLDDIEVILT